MQCTHITRPTQKNDRKEKAKKRRKNQGKTVSGSTCTFQKRIRIRAKFFVNVFKNRADCEPNKQCQLPLCWVGAKTRPGPGPGPAGKGWIAVGIGNGIGVVSIAGKKGHGHSAHFGAFCMSAREIRDSLTGIWSELCELRTANYVHLAHLKQYNTTGQQCQRAGQIPGKWCSTQYWVVAITMDNG